MGYAEKQKPFCVRADVVAALSSEGWPETSTYAEVAADWLAANAGRANVRTWVSRLERVIAPVLGPVIVSSLRPRSIPAIIDLLSLELVRVNERAVAPRTLRAVVRQVSSITSHAVRLGAAQSNPWLGLRLSDHVPDVDADLSWRVGARFTSSEISRLLTDTRQPAWWRAYLCGAAYLGQRHSQTAALQWGDWRGDRIVVARAWSTVMRSVREPKVRVTHEIPVHPALRSVLLGWRSDWALCFGRIPAERDLLFPGTGRAGEPVHIRSDRALRLLKEQLAQIGLRSRGLHALRRSFITELMGAGADRDIVRRFTHARPSDMVDLYNSPPAHRLESTIALLNYNKETHDSSTTNNNA